MTMPMPVCPYAPTYIIGLRRCAEVVTGAVLPGKREFDTPGRLGGEAEEDREIKLVVRVRGGAKDDSVAEDERQQQEQEQQQQDIFTPRRTRSTVNTRLVAVAPPYLKQRMAQAWELPRVRVVQGPAQDKDDEEEKLVACLKYALGLEGGGGVVVEGQKPAVGMVKGVFVELCELLVPKWDRVNV